MEHCENDGALSQRRVCVCVRVAPFLVVQCFGQDCTSVLCVGLRLTVASVASRV